MGMKAYRFKTDENGEEIIESEGQCPVCNGWGWIGSPKYPCYNCKDRFGHSTGKDPEASKPRKEHD